MAITSKQAETKAQDGSTLYLFKAHVPGRTTPVFTWKPCKKEAVEAIQRKYPDTNLSVEPASRRDHTLAQRRALSAKLER